MSSASSSFWRNTVRDLRDDALYALRRIRQAPGFSALTILTTAIGVGATTAIFSVVDAVVLRPIPVPNPESVVRSYETNPSNDAWSTSEPNFLDYRARTRSFTEFGAVTGRDANLLNTGDPIRLSGLAVSASYFALFAGRPIAGSAYVAANDVVGGDKNVVVLSEGVWRRVFGADRRVIGGVANFDGTPYRVLGVMPAGFGYLPADFWVPLAPDPTSNRGNHLLNAFGRLKAGVTLAQANADVQAVATELSKLYPKSNRQWGARVGSFLDFIVGPALRRQLVLLLAAVAMLMLLACANVANLLLVRASTRQREMSIRAALGAGSARIARQLLTESVMLSLLGALVGLGLTWVSVPVIRGAGTSNIPRLAEVTLDVRVLAFALALAIVTGLLFGMAPAFHAIRADLQASLREGSRSIAGAGRGVRDLLVGAEVTLAVVLLVGAGLLGRSFVRMQRVPPGFDATGVLQLRVAAASNLPREQRAQFFTRIDDALAAVPGVSSAGGTSIAPFSGQTINTQFLAEGHEDRTDEYFAADWRSVMPGYFKTLRIGLVRGRLLEATDDTTHPNVTVIDETMAVRLWPGQNPLGKHIMIAQSARTARDQIEVVGVVRDVHDQSLGTDPNPAAYFTEAQKPFVQMNFVVRGRDAVPSRGFIENLRRAFRQAVPSTSLPAIEPLASNVATTMAPQRFTAALLAMFAGVALLLAGIGLFGVVSFGVQQRSQEMGVRLAFGATPGRIVRMVMRDAGLVVIAGAAVGCLGAVLASALLSNMLYATAPTDIATYGAVLTILTATAAAGSYLPARRAARVDPIVAMRGK